MYPQGVCRIRKPACAGNGCAIFPVFRTADWSAEETAEVFVKDVTVSGYNKDAARGLQA